MKKLDVTRLPSQALYGPDGKQIDLASIVNRSRTAITALGNKGLVRPTPSYGFAAALPGDPSLLDWNDPYSFVWFVAGWGPDRDRYVANAVRKLRATLRTGKATLVLREKGGKSFKKVVDSVEPDGSFRWGDFPYGGAVLTGVGGLIIPTAVSCKAEVEDHGLALMHGGLIGGEMLKLDKPKKYGPKP